MCNPCKTHYAPLDNRRPTPETVERLHCDPAAWAGRVFSAPDSVSVVGPIPRSERGIGGPPLLHIQMFVHHTVRGRQAGSEGRVHRLLAADLLARLTPWLVATVALTLLRRARGQRGAIMRASRLSSAQLELPCFPGHKGRSPFNLR